MQSNAMWGPDELEMSAAVKLAACVPFAKAVEVLRVREVGSKQDQGMKTISYLLFAASS